VDSGPTPRRIEIVSGRPLPVRDAADGDGTLAIRLALEALAPSKSSATSMVSAETSVTAPGFDAIKTSPASYAARNSMPVPTRGASARSNGTA
jgi:hypothetical protein